MSKLLLVEDDNNLREIYEARLQAEGYTIVTAKDGEEALAVAKAEKPDLIVSDVMMPKISGFEMLDILKNTDGLKNVKVIMLTALGQSDDQQRADTLGADRYLVKSQVTLEDIVRVAHELLEDGEPAPAAPVPAATTPAPAPATPPPAEPITPAPEPVVAPPVAADPPAAAAATDTSAAEATPAAEESAKLKDQIEDIIEGASTEASAQTEPATPDPALAASTTDPTEPATPTPEPVATPDPSKEEDHDKLMDEAVDSLTSEKEKEIKPEKEPEPVVAPPEPAKTLAPAPATPPPAEPTTAPDDEEDKKDVPSPAVSGSTMSHEKVINPPADSQVEKKPDIQALFAAEQAKEAAAATGVVQPDTPAPAPATPPPAEPAANTDKPDPNSIAL